jgi:hypothetical protein
MKITPVMSVIYRVTHDIGKAWVNITHNVGGMFNVM